MLLLMCYYDNTATCDAGIKTTTHTCDTIVFNPHRKVQFKRY